MAAVAHREVERKYEVPEGAAARVDWGLLQGYSVAADAAEHRMEAVYYDTDDMALGRRRVALRRRRGGADDGWHVKLSEPAGRQELQVPLLRTPDRIPAAVRNLLAGLTRGRALRPVATLHTDRRVLMVSDDAGTAVAELAVDVVEAVDERTGTPRAWSEWELELVDGTIPVEEQEEIFDAVEAAVFAVGGRPSSSRAKVARALGTEDDDTPARPGEAAGRKKSGKGSGTKSAEKPAKKSPGPEVLRAVLGELAERLVLWDFKVRMDAPDAVHQMRVTSRSLRSLLRAAAPLFEGEEAEELDGRLRDLARALSAARDAEVIAELLAVRVGDLDGRVDAGAAEVLQRSAEEQARTAAGSARKRVGAKEHTQLLADVQSFAAAPPLTEECARLSAREVSDMLMLRALRKVVRVAERGAAAQDGGATGEDGRLEHLHEVRKAVKRVRYVHAVLDGAGFRPGKALRRAAGDAEDYQDALGRVMDAAVVERWLAGTALSLRGSGADRYTVGVLHGAELVRLSAGVDGGADVVGVLLSQLREDLD